MNQIPEAAIFEKERLRDMIMDMKTKYMDKLDDATGEDAPYFAGVLKGIEEIEKLLGADE